MRRPNKKKGTRDGVRKRTETAEERKAREEREDEEWEQEMEEKCERFCSRACTAWIVMTPLISVISTIGEFALRPDMPVPNIPLGGQYAVITGGCGEIGSETAQMLVAAGANVVLGCRNESIAEDFADRIRSKIKIPIPAASEEEDDDESFLEETQKVGSIYGWELQMDSFASVRGFAARYQKEFGNDFGLQILLLNAATGAGCTYTKDQNELIFQTNHLSHFLLTHQLMPSLQKRARDSGSRVVSVVCDAGYSRYEGFLDVTNLNSDKADREKNAQHSTTTPAGAPAPAPVPDVDSTIEKCDVYRQYANSKLVQISFAAELERRLRASSQYIGIVSHAINPGDTKTTHSGPPPAPERQSMRAWLISYLPPVWLVRRVFSYAKDQMKRPLDHAARALFHVAASGSLAQTAVGELGGGGLFSDQIGPLTHCGRDPSTCGLQGPVYQTWSPIHLFWGGPPLRKTVAEARDTKLGTELWDASSKLVGERFRAL